jgi:hypothetical protein
MKDLVSWLGRQRRSVRNHSEAKAGENIGQGKTRKAVTETAKQAN